MIYYYKLATRSLTY